MSGFNILKMNIRKIANPFNIVFTESNHSYSSDINPNHISVTTLLKKYQNEFPKDALDKYAEKNNLTEEYVKYCWDEQRRLGTEIGSWLHIQLENRLNNKIPDLNYLLTQEDSLEKQLIKNQYLTNYEIQINKYLEEVKDWNYLGSEMIVGNKKYAGQIDTPFSTHLDDFKNDKVINFTNKWQKLKYPFDDLDDCNWNKYCLQINMYRALLPKSISDNFTRPDRIIKFDRSSQDYQVYEVPDLQHRIKEIL